MGEALRRSSPSRGPTCEPRSRTYRPRRSAGFTFIELVLVLGILAIIISFAIPSLDGLTPKYRLRTAARRLASQLENARVTAISRERWMGLRYVFDDVSLDGRPFYQVIPPAPLDDPHQPLAERRMLSKTLLPVGVRFYQIVLAGNRDADGGVVDVLFSPNGTSGSHVVTLAGEADKFVSLKFNCITGILEYLETAEAGFEHFED